MSSTHIEFCVGLISVQSKTFVYLAISLSRLLKEMVSFAL